MDILIFPSLMHISIGCVQFQISITSQHIWYHVTGDGVVVFIRVTSRETMIEVSIEDISSSYVRLLGFCFGVRELTDVDRIFRMTKQNKCDHWIHF